MRVCLERGSEERKPATEYAMLTYLGQQPVAGRPTLMGGVPAVKSQHLRHPMALCTWHTGRRFPSLQTVLTHSALFQNQRISPRVITWRRALWGGNVALRAVAVARRHLIVAHTCILQ